MKVNYNYFNELEQPELTLCNPNDEQVGQLDNVQNLAMTIAFGELSEVSFDIYKYSDDTELPIYDLVVNKRQVFVEDIGYFVIENVKETFVDGNVFKSVTCYSTETELANFEVAYLKGTYAFYNEEDKENSLMHILFKSLPRWNFGHIDEVLLNTERRRTFDVPEDNVYNFLMNDVQDAYECLFDFFIIKSISTFKVCNFEVCQFCFC